MRNCGFALYTMRHLLFVKLCDVFYVIEDFLLDQLLDSFLRAI